MTPVTWFHNRPFRKRPLYPAVLDIAEQAVAVAGTPAVAAAARAIAPRWEDLQQFGLADIELDLESGPLQEPADRVLQHYLQRNESSTFQYLMDSLALAVASLGPAFGAVFHGARRFDQASARFARSLQQEAARTGFHVRFPARAPAAAKPPSDTCEGWGYLRLGGAALAARDEDRILAQHVPYINGILFAAPELAHRQLLAVAGIYTRRRIRSRTAAHLYLTAARLTMTLAIPGQFRIAHGLCKRALRCFREPEERLPVIEELANVGANQKRGPALDIARSWCQHGLDLSRRLPEGEIRAQAEIRLSNTLALVEYHQGNNQAALELENHAMRLTSEAAAAHPEIERWARPMLNRNLAQLLALRFHELDRAVDLLADNLSLDASPITRESDIVNLARMHFDRREFRRAADLLTECYERGQPASLAPEKESFGRALLAVSLLHLGELARLQAQIDQLEALSRSTRSLGTTQLVEALRLYTRASMHGSRYTS